LLSLSNIYLTETFQSIIPLLESIKKVNNQNFTGIIDGKNRREKPLLYAIDRSYNNIVKELINYGADISVKGMYGRRAIHYAIEKNNIEILKLLLEKGEDIEIKDNNGKTAIFYAIKNKNISIIEFLLEKGSNIFTKDKSGKIPLHYASEINNIEILNLLLEKGSDISAKDKSGRIPLHYASQINNIEILNLLLEKGSDISTKDKSGKTVFHYASQLANIELLNLLLEKGIDISVKDKSGKTALFYAANTANIFRIRHNGKTSVKYCQILKTIIENGSTSCDELTSDVNFMLYNFCIHKKDFIFLRKLLFFSKSYYISINKYDTYLCKVNKKIWSNYIIFVKSFMEKTTEKLKKGLVSQKMDPITRVFLVPELINSIKLFI
jgi:ankyrin repeat protein